jgi:hypothetical protein
VPERSGALLPAGPIEQEPRGEQSATGHDDAEEEAAENQRCHAAFQPACRMEVKLPAHRDYPLSASEKREANRMP